VTPVDNANSDLFNQSLPAALVIGVLGGAVLFTVGLVVATDWRGWARRYSDVIDNVVARRKQNVDSPSLVPNRVIFAVIGLFGAALLVGGLVSAIH
jgi:hypothetical protein